MSEKKIEYEQCDCCGWKESPIVDIDDFGKSCCFNCFINYNPKAKKEYDNQLKKAQQELIEKVLKLLEPEKDMLTFICKGCGEWWSSMQDIKICDKKQGGCGEKLIAFINVNELKDKLNKIKKEMKK